MTEAEWENTINDDNAYAKLYVGYYKKFYNYGKKFTGNTLIIEDAIQEVFLDAWAKKGKMLQVRSVEAYFFSSFRYILFQKLKQNKKQPGNEGFPEEPSFSIESVLINREMHRALQVKLKIAFERLTTRQCEAVFLRFYQNLSYDQVAQVLGISVKATYKIIARSLTALRETMVMPAAFLFYGFCLYLF